VRARASFGKWGPVLFAATIAVTLVFFWWLLIYDHGVVAAAG